MSVMELQLTTTADDATRYREICIYKKEGITSTMGISTEHEYPLDDDQLISFKTVGKFFDLETIDYIELGGVKYEIQKNFNTSEKD